MTEQEIFFEAIEITDSTERVGFVRGACGDNVVLRRKVDELLNEHFSSDTLLAKAAVEQPVTVTQETPILEGPGTLIDRYKLLQRLGEGGFGIVYMAEQKEPVKRRVALKIIKLGMDTKQVVARFEAERQALAMMDHPNIAKVLDAGSTETGRPYFVMELVKGVAITKYCNDNHLTTKERLDLFIPVCQAIQHAHQKGIIHRDIKPSNVMITLHDGQPVPKVIDFGIAKATQQELTEKTIFTQYSQFIGTPAYMSPEQAEMSGLDVDTRSDIYSLGVLLYELLVGRTPLDAKDLMSGGYDEIRRRIKEEEPPKPSTRVSTMEYSEKSVTAKYRKLGPEQLSSELRGDLDWIVLKALEKDRTRRYETANGFVKDIERYLCDEPVTAVAPSRSYLLKKYLRRHKSSLAVAATIAGLLVAGVSISTWQAVRATRAQSIADTEREIANQQRLLAQQKQKSAELAESVADQERQRAEAEKVYSERLLYAANMNLVQMAFEADNYLTAQQLLDETSDSPNRGFEWDYWQARMHEETLMFGGHSGPVRDIEFSPDGERVASCDENGWVRIWERSSGREMTKVAAPGRQVSFSPDGEHLLLQSLRHDWNTNSNGLRIVSARTGEVVLNNLHQYTHGDYSPDARQILVYNHSQVAIVNALTGENLVSILDLQEHPDESLMSKPISKAFYLADGPQVLAVLRKKGGGVFIWHWEAGSGRTLNGEFSARNNASFAVSPDSRWLTVGNRDEITRWGLQGILASGTELDHKPILTPSTRMDSVKFHYSPDSRYILTSLDDHTARVWDLSTETEIRKLRGHDRRISAVSWSPDGRWMATGDAGGSIRIWDVEDRESPAVWPEVETVQSISRDGRKILTSRPRAVWDARSLEPVRVLPDPEYFVRSLADALSPDGRRVLVLGELQNGTYRTEILDAASGTKVFQIDHSKHSPNKFIQRVKFSPDSQFIIVGEAPAWESHSNQWLQIFNARTGQLEKKLDHHTARVHDAEISPDGKYVVSASASPIGRTGFNPADPGVRIWDFATSELLHHLRNDVRNPSKISFAPDSQRFAVQFGNLVKMFETTTGEVSLILSGHSQVGWAITFSPDGRRILTSGDRVLKFWDARTGRELLTLKGHQGHIGVAQFFPDGTQIVTSSRDHSTRFWKAKTPRSLVHWQGQEQARKERLARIKREPGAIKQWLVLSPIDTPGSDGAVTLEEEQHPAEAFLTPKPNQSVSIQGTQYNWQPWQKDQHKIDFQQLSGVRQEYCVAYAVTYIRSDSEKRNLLLKTGHDDQSKIYLNGSEIYRWPQSRAWVAEQTTVPGIQLNAGLNTLVLKVVNLEGEWAGSIWITDAEGNPVPGLTVTLDPDQTTTPASID